MPPKRARTSMVDLTDAAADTLLQEHVRAVDASVERLWPYATPTRKCNPVWKELWKHRHFLTDLVIETRGLLVKPTKWEEQVEGFLQKTTQRVWEKDTVTLVADRPRHMLSHLWQAKRDSLTIPKAFVALSGIINAMNVPPKPKTDTTKTNIQDLMNNPDEDGEDTVQIIIIILYY